MRDELGRFNEGIRPGKRIDITGKKFNKLTAIECVERKGNHSFWLFRCECGVIHRAERSKVTSGLTKSCGCWRLVSRIRHGLSSTRFYHIHRNMIVRCDNPTNKHYKNYGGRGIRVCESWKEFINFKNDMYESYVKHVVEFGEKQTMIERKKNNEGYNPDNCTWATWAEQVLNKRPQSSAFVTMPRNPAN